MRPIDKFREYNKQRKLKAMENKKDYKTLRIRSKEKYHVRE